MEDDSFKYLGHETAAELVAELRNKMGSVVNYVDLLKMKNDGEHLDFVEKILPKSEENLLKSMPLILRFLKEFEQYDLDIKKREVYNDESVIERNGSHVHLKMGDTGTLSSDFMTSGDSLKKK